METENSQQSKEERIYEIKAEMKNIKIGNSSGTSNTNNEKYLRYKELEKELDELVPPPQ